MRRPLITWPRQRLASRVRSLEFLLDEAREERDSCLRKVEELRSAFAAWPYSATAPLAPSRPWSEIKRKGNVSDPLRIMRIHAHRARLLLMMAGWW